MNSFKQLLILLLGVSLSSCSDFEHSSRLNDSVALQNHFTNPEINELSKILNFVDHEICGIRGTNKINASCYLEYFERLYVEIKGDVGEYQKTINYERQKKLLSSIDKNLLDSVLVEREITSYVKVPRLNEIVDSAYSYKVTYVKPNGKLNSYFEEISSSENRIKLFLTQCKNIGTFSSMLFNAEVMMRWNEIDFNKAETRLFIALFLLEINSKDSQSLHRNELIIEDIRNKFKERRKTEPS